MTKIGGVLMAITLFACSVLAQGAATPELQVPAIREPHHFVKLDNKYARVLDVTVEPFSGTLYHIHENPYFWIAIGAATLRGQTLGAQEIINIEPADSEVRYSPALTHRVGNIAATPFRNITVQIQSRDDVSTSTSHLATPKPTGYQAKPVLDNQLVYIERLVLEPGQSTGRYTIPRSGMIIAAHDGTITVERPGSPAHRIEMKAGDFDWHTGPISHTITNVGKARFEAIEAVWK
jgi:hypothetical protein